MATDCNSCKRASKRRIFHKKLAQEVYLHLFFNKEIDPELNVSILRLSIAKIFTGWTLEYIDSLPLKTILEIMAILEGQARYEKGMNRHKT